MESKTISQSINEEIESFFSDPKIYEPKTSYGTLYLLRRDANYCIKGPAQWAGAMVILAGIDLLGTFYDGDDDFKKVGKRFKAYFKKYIDKDNAEIIYQLRNSLLHSFGLYSKNDKSHKIYQFHVCAANKELVQYYSEKTDVSNKEYKIISCVIDLIKLRNEFDESIKKYKSDLMINDNLRTKFHKMFNIYGIKTISYS